MATTIGTVIFNVNLDGKTLPAQARKIGAQIAEGLNSADKKKPFADTSKSLRNVNKESDRFFKTWKELPHGFRQAALYTGLFASLGSQISILGSATGSGLATIAIAATALGVAFAAIAVGFSGITGDMAGIAEAARPAIQAFRDLAAPFKELQQSVQGALFAGLEGQISSLATSFIPALNAGLTTTASTVNALFSQILTGLQSEKGIQTLQTLFAGFQPIITNIGQGLIQLFGAIGNIAVAGLPTAQLFASVFNDLLTQFNTFTSSVEGQQTLFDFFQHGQQIFSAILPLVGAVATALSSLVTPQTIALLVTTLDNLTQFIPILGQVLGVIAVLDPIGIIALLLKQVGDALAPVMPQLLSFAEILSGAIKNALIEIGPLLPSLVGAIVDLAVALLPLVLQLLPPFVQILTLLIPQVVLLIEALLPLVPLLGDVLANAITIALDLFAGFMPLISGIIQVFTGLITFLTGVFTGDWDKIWKGLTDIVAAQFNNTVNIVKGVLNAIIAVINGSIRGINKIASAVGFPTLSQIPALASGGLVSSPMRALIGEAGPEAVVPLNRPLAQVDPQVRALSAIAQGKAVPGSTGSGRSFTVAAGAIQVTGVRNEGQAASAMLDRLVALGGT